MKRQLSGECIYYCYMGGVDCLDQNILAYTISSRSEEWWPLWFLFCTNFATCYTFQLYRLRKVLYCNSVEQQLKYIITFTTKIFSWLLLLMVTMSNTANLIVE